MKVILKQTNKIKQVSFGYAVNYLFPQGLAIPASEKNLAVLKKDEKLKFDKTAQEKKENERKAKKLNRENFLIKAKIGEKGRLFGTVSKKELSKILGVDKKEIILEKPIKKAGKHKVELKFGENKAEVTIEIKEGK